MYKRQFLATRSLSPVITFTATPWSSSAGIAARALSFGDAADEKGEVARLAKDHESFRLLAGLGTGPKVLYRSSDSAVRERLSRTGVTRG